MACTGEKVRLDRQEVQVQAGGMRQGLFILSNN
jgi:hypothetical protein